MFKTFTKRFFAVGLAAVIAVAFSLAPVPASAKSSYPSKPSVTVTKKWSDGNMYCVAFKYKSKNANKYMIKSSRASRTYETKSRTFIMMFCKQSKAYNANIYVRGIRIKKNGGALYGPQKAIKVKVPQSKTTKKVKKGRTA